MADLGWISFDALALLIVVVCAVTSLFIAWGSLGTPRLFDLVILIILLITLAALATGITNKLVFYLMWEVTAFAGWGLGRWAASEHRQTMMGALPMQGFGALGSLTMAVALLMLTLVNRNPTTSGLDAGSIGLFVALLLAALFLKSFALLSPAWYPSRDERSFYLAHGTLAGAVLPVIGLYPFLRFFFDNMAGRDDWQEPVLTVTMIVALVTALAASGAYDLHKVLAYLTLSQFAGLLALFALLRPEDWTLVIAATLSYVLAMTGLSLSLGAVAAATNQRDLRQMGGLIDRMPIAGVLFLLCGLSLAGVPPLAGFTMRLFGGLALFAHGDSAVAYLLFLLGGLTLLAVLRAFRAIFLGSLPPLAKPARDASLSVVLVGGLVVLGLLFVGALPETALDLLKPAVALTLK